MTRIYLIRHAEAEGNIYRRAHGHFDSLLTKNGLAQTERLAEWFSLRPVAAVYASDLYRARRTAGAAASACQKSVTTDPGLREIGLGEWEDRPWGGIAREYPNYNSWFGKDCPLSVPGAERYEEARERAEAALARIAAAHGGQDIAVVSHGCVIRALLEKYTGGPVRHLDNASISCLEWHDGNFRVLNAGENRHLGELSTLAKQLWWRDDPDMRDAELWFSPARLPDDEDAVLEVGKAAWETVYGTMNGFIEENSVRAHREAAVADPRNLQFVMEEEQRIGLLLMRDAGRLSVSDAHVALFYLSPDKRGKGLGAQLLGEAVSIARAGGKTALSLRVYHQNTQALAFYRKMGFTVCGSEKGLFGAVIQMRMPVTVPDGG